MLADTPHVSATTAAAPPSLSLLCAISLAADPIHLFRFIARFADGLPQEQQQAILSQLSPLAIVLFSSWAKACLSTDAVSELPLDDPAVWKTVCQRLGVKPRRGGPTEWDLVSSWKSTALESSIFKTEAGRQMLTELAAGNFGALQKMLDEHLVHPADPSNELHILKGVRELFSKSDVITLEQISETIIRDSVSSVDYLTIQSSLLKQPGVRKALALTEGQVRSVELHNLEPSTVDYAAEYLSSILPGLESLSLNFGKLEKKEQFLKLIHLGAPDLDASRYTTITSLRLISTVIPETAVTGLTNFIASLSNLAILRLHDCELSEQDLAHVITAAPSATIRVLDLAHCSVGSSSGRAMGGLLRNSATVRELRLVDLHEERSMITLSFWQLFLDSLAFNRSLETLHIAQVPLGHNIIIQIGTALASHPTLRRLVMDGCFHWSGYYGSFALQYMWEKLALRQAQGHALEEIHFLDCLWLPTTIPDLCSFFTSPIPGLKILRLSLKSSNTHLETVTQLLTALPLATYTLAEFALTRSSLTHDMLTLLFESISDGRLVHRILRAPPSPSPDNLRDRAFPTFRLDLSGNPLLSDITTQCLISAWDDFTALPHPPDIADIPARDRVARFIVDLSGATLSDAARKGVRDLNGRNGMADVGLLVVAGADDGVGKSGGVGWKGRSDGFDEM